MTATPDARLAARPRILCVDDEAQILEAMILNLGRRYHVSTALNGALGLEKIRSEAPFAVLISDMRMPGMDGATFLKHAFGEAPNTVRILLTGQAELSAAIAAVNEGQIFRFLSKPCPPASLLKTIEAAVEQNRLITSEKVLLEQPGQCRLACDQRVDPLRAHRRNPAGDAAGGPERDVVAA